MAARSGCGGSNWADCRPRSGTIWSASGGGKKGGLGRLSFSGQWMVSPSSVLLRSSVKAVCASARVSQDCGNTIIRVLPRLAPKQCHRRSRPKNRSYNLGIMIGSSRKLSTRDRADFLSFRWKLCCSAIGERALCPLWETPVQSTRPPHLLVATSCHSLSSRWRGEGTLIPSRATASRDRRYPQIVCHLR